MGISIGIAGIHAGNIDHYFHAASVGVLLVARERALQFLEAAAHGCHHHVLDRANSALECDGSSCQVEVAARSTDSSAVTLPRAGPLRWGPVEERAVPMSEIGSCGIGGLNEGKHGLIG
jgi:hypothetical protein